MTEWRHWRHGNNTQSMDDVKLQHSLFHAVVTSELWNLSLASNTASAVGRLYRMGLECQRIHDGVGSVDGMSMVEMLRLLSRIWPIQWHVREVWIQLELLISDSSVRQFWDSGVVGQQRWLVQRMADWWILPRWSNRYTIFCSIVSLVGREGDKSC